MRENKHRVGIGYEPRAPTGLMEHSPAGARMEAAFQNSFLNKLFDYFIRLSTSDRILNLARHAAGGKLIKLPKKALDLVCLLIDRLLITDPHNTKQAMLGKIISVKYKSVFGGYLWELLNKYVADWARRQDLNIQIKPPIRRLSPLKKTYKGWKKLRNELQPGWKIFPKNPDEIVKILPEDQMNPYHRIENIIKGKSTDRVALGLGWDWGTPYMGGSNMWKACYDGIERAWAAINVWIRTGGSDFLPSAAASAVGGYTIPFPDTHSRMFFKWGYPASDSMPPQFHEIELLKSYEDLYNYGATGIAQEFTKRMIRDVFILLREIWYGLKVSKHYFGPYQDQFFPMPGSIFAVWDYLPMARSLVPFSRDMRKHPEAVIEAFEFLNKPLTDFFINIAKLTKAKVALIGNSRGSNSFISPKMFEDLFWPSMKYSFEQCFKNDIIPLCHLDNDWTQNMVLFAEKLPKRSCIFHLDQVDLVEVHELIGDHFCLMGGMSPGLLVLGTPEKVEAAAKRYIEHIGEDGLIISSGCEQPFDTPIQTIYALKRAIKKYGYF